MNKKQKVGCTLAVVRVLVLTPIWYYIWYNILRLVNAGELMMFLFWAYIPISVVTALLEGIAENILDD